MWLKYRHRKKKNGETSSSFEPTDSSMLHTSPRMASSVVENGTTLFNVEIY
jgi:hypothetical protein